MVFRGLTTSAREEWGSVAATSFFKQAIETRQIIATEVLSPAAARDVDPSLNGPPCFDIRRIPFVTYPYEWCFGMLKNAALLQFELLEAALVRGNHAEGCDSIQRAMDRVESHFHRRRIVRQMDDR